MEDLAGRSCVVTGAASGIGRGLALRAAAEGMRVLAADVDEAGLEETATAVQRAGAECGTLRVDVSRRADLERLADTAWRAFGGVDLLFNNAGVLVPGSGWERSEDDWAWQLGVNLWGVIHGVSVFLPRMIERGEPAHVVNTASVGGLLVGPFLTPYIVSKHAVVALSEALHQELRLRRAPVRISCLCPGAVRTGIARSERVRPAERGDPAALVSSLEQRFAEGLDQGLQGGMSPEEVAAATFERVRAGRFWILPDPSFQEAVEQRLRSILSGEDPAVPGALDPDA